MEVLQPNSQISAELLEMMNDTTEGDVAPANIAFLEDRLLTMDDEPQEYGTQFRRVNNTYVPFLIRDPENVNNRRLKRGLGTYEENLRRLEDEYREHS